MEDPRDIFLSPHFRLSDFLGNHTVYSLGLPNRFDEGGDLALKCDNLDALCNAGLEPLLARVGPISISYGYISPSVSQRIVTYQDPQKPSHHRFDLGAACDFVAHRWVQGLALVEPTLAQLFMDENTRTSPIALASHFDEWRIPYSRLITYSESPYICLAISASEVTEGAPRGAFYENRYLGKPRQKPDYRKYPATRHRERLLTELQKTGLPHPWQGSGYPTYHGGGRRQFHHRRTGKFSMVSDWLYEAAAVNNGYKNAPNLSNENILDQFIVAGFVFDEIFESANLPRISILEGYIAPTHPYCWEDRAWSNEQITFCVGGPSYVAPHDFLEMFAASLPYAECFADHRGVWVTVDVPAALAQIEAFAAR